MLTLQGTPTSQAALIIDSGATDHIISNKSFLSDVRRVGRPAELITACGIIVHAMEIGTLSCMTGGKTMNIHNVWYAPEIKVNLLSERRLIEKGGYVFKDHKIWGRRL